MKAFLLVCIAIWAIVWCVLASTSTTAGAPATSASSPSPPPAAKPVEAAPRPLPLPPSPPPAPVAGAEQAVEHQLAVIDIGDLDAFRATFTSDVKVTPEALAACRTRVHQVPVRPDWEMAEDSIDEHGQRVRRVSMFGKSLTGFHEQGDGRWLADALWCVPVGLP